MYWVQFDGRLSNCVMYESVYKVCLDILVTAKHTKFSDATVSEWRIDGDGDGTRGCTRRTERRPRSAVGAYAACVSRDPPRRAAIAVRSALFDRRRWLAGIQRPRYTSITRWPQSQTQFWYRRTVAACRRRRRSRRVTYCCCYCH